MCHFITADDKICNIFLGCNYLYVGSSAVLVALLADTPMNVLA